MENKSNEIKQEILYFDIKKLIITLIFTLLLYFTIVYCYMNNIVFNFPFIQVTYLIGSSCMLIILKSTYKIYKKDYINYLRILFLIIAILTAKKIVPFNSIDILDVFKSDVLFDRTIIFFSVVLIYFFTKRAFENRAKRSVIFVIIIALLYSLKSIIIENSWFKIVIVALTIIGVFKTIYTQRFFSRFKKIRNREINFLYYGGYLIYISALLNIVSVIDTNHTLIINILYNLIHYVGFLTILFIITNWVINNPNKIIFRQLYDKNVELNELNKMIKIQNRELEVSQILIKKKDNMVKTFFRNIPIPLVFLNLKTKRITFANRSFMEFTEENNFRNVVNRRFDSFFKDEIDDSNVYGVSSIEEMIVKGQIKYVSIEIIDESIDQEEIMISITDITEKVKMQQMKEKLKNKIFEEKLKRDFLSNISHDLKTPVNVIYSAAQLIDIYINDKNFEGIKKYNNISKQNCVSLTKFTNNLIDRSKVYSEDAPGKFLIMNIVEVVENTVQSLVDYAKNKNIELIFDTDEEEIYVNINCDFMERIILNLISNSIKFSKDQGYIYISIQSFNEYIKIVIEDNGVGMEQEFVQVAFSRYSMGENKQVPLEKGTGIGLAVVKKLVENQNGEILVDSKIGEGTKIELKFKKVKECLKN